MGKERMDKLLKLLPDDGEVIGLDEHTGMVVDLADKKMEIMGKGNYPYASYNFMISLDFDLKKRNQICRVM